VFVTVLGLYAQSLNFVCDLVVVKIRLGVYLCYTAALGGTEMANLSGIREAVEEGTRPREEATI
jgi:hypothetical protein